MIPFGFVQEHRQSETWDLVARRVGMSSFSAQLTSGYYQMWVTGGTYYTENPPYLEIWDSDGNRIYRFDDFGFGWEYFTIGTPGNYDFYIYRWLSTHELEIEISKRSYESYIIQPYTGLVAIGIILLLAGVGVLVYGLVAKVGLKGAQTPPPTPPKS